MKVTAKAPANIAFIKYWGKKDDALRLPANASFSMNLSGAWSTTTVEFSGRFKFDDITLDGGDFTEKEKARIVGHLDRIREKAQLTKKAKVVTQNSFPKGAGSASSASGFAALTVAAAKAAGLDLKERELTILARIASGSACRSIPDGFVVWEEGTSSENSYAHALYSQSYWDLSDILVIVDSSMKKVPTTEGQEGAATSLFFQERVRGIPQKMKRLRQFFTEKNFRGLGELIEDEALNLHHVIQTQTPPVYYWNNTTEKIMQAVPSWRKHGLPVYFTIDAGPNVHLICETADAPAVQAYAQRISGVEKCLMNNVCAGAHFVDTHLF